MEIRFRVRPVEVSEEIPAGFTPKEAAEMLSKKKADAFPQSEWNENLLLITADTIVAAGSEILGKPADKADAIKILRKLSDKTHVVITGITLKNQKKSLTFSDQTNVSFKELNDSEIEYYVDRYQPFDKAGAYGIQEWIGHTAIEKIEGSYFNVMGLPTYLLYKELIAFIGQDER